MNTRAVLLSTMLLCGGALLTGCEQPEPINDVGSGAGPTGGAGASNQNPENMEAGTETQQSD